VEFHKMNSREANAESRQHLPEIRRVSPEHWLAAAR
jgi:hypothetical protein